MNDIVMADSLCGTGVRGLRVAVEVPEVNQVYLNKHQSLQLMLLGNHRLLIVLKINVISL